LQDFLRGKPYGRMAGRKRLFTERDLYELVEDIGGVSHPKKKLRPKLLAKLRELVNRGKSDRDGFIYFLSDLHGRIKIGFALKDVKLRVLDLQIGNADQLTIEAIIPGTQQQEIALHDHFERYCVRGEWFTFSHEIRNWLAG
jgi:hypothetical protein